MLGKIFGTRNDRYLKSIQPLVDKINALESQFQQMDDEELKGYTDVLRSKLSDGAKLDSLLPEAFAAVREGAFRAIGLRAYDVQLLGGIIQHQGKISEMKTGEGKTLVATFPTYLNALMGKGVHVVTVNDYLAKRDAEWMTKVYNALGMTCGYIIGEMTPQERKEAYAADITYATNNELGFDFLRDNMAFNLEGRVQREHYFAIVDEVDSILIDEARTPLIISGPTEDKTEMYQTMDAVMAHFKAGDHYEVDEKGKAVALNDAGMDHAENVLRDQKLLKEDESLYEMEQVMLVHHLNQALRAHTLFQKDVDYIVQNNQVIIIDEFTGRMMPGRRFSEGLHQALEAKEGAEIQNENQTLASVTFQNYFRIYEKLSGMTGTADTEAEEFESIYGLGVTIVPTHVDVKRDDAADKIYRTAEEKMEAIVADIRECYERGQPVLVGTTSIDKSEAFSEFLKKVKVPHQVLNARHHEQEAEIIAQAGRLGAVTIATNMAGRGTDIKLGGNLDLLIEEAAGDEKKEKMISSAYEREKEDVLSVGGLRVIGTERHESRRIDNQLRGRSGRQGDPGSTIFYLSLQDDLMRLFAKNLDVMMERLEMPKGEAIQSRLVTTAIETAQRKIEARNFEMRKTLLKYDDVLNDQRKVIYEQRREVMASDAVDDIIVDFREEILDQLMAYAFPMGTYQEQWDIEDFERDLDKFFAIEVDVKAWLEAEEIAPEEIRTRVFAQLEQAWAAKEEKVTPQVMRQLEKSVLLQVLDNEWKDHLQRLDFLRQGIHLRGYGQKDPLQEFKKEGFAMFEHLLVAIRDHSIQLLARVEVQFQEDRNEAYLPEEQAKTDKNPYANADVARNAPCPCGSGKKYKYCHGKIN